MHGCGSGGTNRERCLDLLAPSGRSRSWSLLLPGVVGHRPRAFNDAPSHPADIGQFLDSDSCRAGQFPFPDEGTLAIRIDLPRWFRDGTSCGFEILACASGEDEMPITPDHA